MPKLAINGGSKVRTKLFPKQDTFDEREEKAVIEVLRNGKLSGYRGNWCPEFFGGEQIQALETEFAKKFGAKYAIACNSATSGLQIACGAIGLAPGDEVIVTPWSMSCSATAPLLWNAIPIFADIEKDNYCLDPDSIESKITDKTKAIIIVDLFGLPYDVERINAIAKKHNLMIIEDAAQAIGSCKSVRTDLTSNKYEKKYAGTFGDIGVFSFNYGKHITCGEGGMIITDNENLAMRCRLIMNHAEAVINGMLDDVRDHQYYNCSLNMNMLGFNMRMTEINAAIMRVQLEKFDTLQEQRWTNCGYLGYQLENLPPIIRTQGRGGCSNTFYVQAFQWIQEKAEGIKRDKFIEAVKAELMPIENRMEEGVPLSCGYIKPLYLFPLFQNKQLYGGTKEVFLKETIEYKNHYEYEYYEYPEGLCPVAEDLWKNKLFLHRFIAPPTTIDDLKDVVEAFNKVWENRQELK